LEVGNEGKVVMGVVKEKAEDALDALRGTKKGKDAEIIGSFCDERDEGSGDADTGWRQKNAHVRKSSE